MLVRNTNAKLRNAPTKAAAELDWEKNVFHSLSSSRRCTSTVITLETPLVISKCKLKHVFTTNQSSLFNSRVAGTSSSSGEINWPTLATDLARLANDFCFPMALFF
mmetsp:Transcript_327/g.470  ORF Transcript_327/g.470 Transcript_327/m.470 type:complete len:106 (-) Transcript_327:383-700(-)